MTCDYQPSRKDPCGRCVGCLSAEVERLHSERADLIAMLREHAPHVVIGGVATGYAPEVQAVLHGATAPADSPPPRRR